MKNLWIASALFASTLMLVGVDTISANQKSISLTPIGTYASGIYALGGAEIVAHDPRTQRLFVVNAQAATVDVLSIRDPSHPAKVGEIDVTPFGGSPTVSQCTRGSSPLSWKTPKRQNRARGFF